jgi:phthalate 4,5-cis-dihydrodiol dehydrogenase
LTEARRLGVAVAGLGIAGQRDLAAVMAHPGVELVAVADRHEQLLAVAPAGVARYGDLADLCRDDRVDAVWVATPHELHPLHARTAAAAGKHVIVEKPLALTVEECDGITQAASSSGVVLVVGHTESFAPDVRKARELIASGQFGPVRMIVTCNFTDFLYRPRRPEELDTARGGGIVFAQLPHQVDVVRLLTGSAVRAVRASVGAWDPGRPVEAACTAFVDFASGCAASLVYSGYDHFDTRDISCAPDPLAARTPQPGRARRQLGRLAADHDSEVGARVTRATALAGGGAGTGDPPFGFTLISCDDADLRLAGHAVAVYGSDGYREIGVEPSRGLPARAEVLDELLDAVTHGRPALHDGEWGRQTLEVCLAILRSARERREVLVTVQDPVIETGDPSFASHR